jgi:hypothetical protein
MMHRLPFLLAALVVLGACSNDCPPCKEGVTFYISDVAGSLAPGTEETLKFCFDGQCKDTTISRADAGGTVFVEFSGVGKGGDHAISVAGPASVQGEYKGPISTFDQGGGSCSCAVAAVKVGADGTLTPGTAAVSSTTSAPATTGG